MCNFFSSSFRLFILVAILPQCIFAANILFFHLMATSSHRTSIWPLAEKLAENGHNVTYIFPMDAKPLGTHPKIQELVPSKMLPIIKDFIGDFDINIRLNNTVNDWSYQIFKKSVELCEAFYQSPEIIKWLNKPEEKYDLLLIDGIMGECGYGLVHKFQAKFISFLPTPITPFTYDGIGIVPESASIPDPFFHKKPESLPNSLINRLMTTLSAFIWRLGALDFMRRVYPIITNSFPNSEIPSLLDIEANMSLLLVNSHFVEDYAMSLPPMIQSYSGLWCSKSKLKNRKELPTELEKFIQEGKEGFVYVSLGSAVDVSKMPEKLKQEIFTAFEQFSNMRFLWRWTGDLKNVSENLPKNVKLQNWFPQHDLLGHPKIKAFLTQAGRPSTQEAFCHGVPMIAMPIFADQDYNADRLEHIGAAVLLDIENLTADKLKSAILSVASTDKYKNRAKELSAIFRDRPIDPLENAVYWVEYVLRHDTSLLKPPGMKQHWWQRRLLDVYVVMGIAVVTVIMVVMVITGLCFRRLFCAKTKTKTE